MHKLSFKLISATIGIFTLLSGSSAWSQNYQLGTAQFSGNGCPSGSAAVSVSPDAQAISFLFDQFSTSLGTQSGKSKKLMCTIIIPITEATGFLVESTYIDFRGFISMGPQGRLTLMTSSLKGIAKGGLIGDSAFSDLRGAQQNNFSLRQIVRTDTVKRKCFTQKELVLNITATLESGKMKNANGIETQFTMDSGDIGSEGVTLGVAVRPCSF